MEYTIEVTHNKFLKFFVSLQKYAKGGVEMNYYARLCFCLYKKLGTYENVATELNIYAKTKTAKEGSFCNAGMVQKWVHSEKAVSLNKMVIIEEFAYKTLEISDFINSLQIRYLNFQECKAGVIPK